ncbi:hypothetical protein J2128_000502 [Methanomicrobium sp. W14]|uniref:hypothetical protein n=1 Tax=Methanomicrobium sp. W14 TaxID=2817839 RepID=UPI001AEB83BC|nr:hypothetical protein [Methanomicrobium sp. W14]MBP2132581.1 hypothetical protein [Methanomicrobium sp. W14]
MREEDLDWKIYHIIAYRENIPINELKKVSGAGEADLFGSVERLVKNCLIEKDDEKVRVLSLPETIMKNNLCCLLKNDDSESPVIIENGVIKSNPNYTEKI